MFPLQPTADSFGVPARVRRTVLGSARPAKPNSGVSAGLAKRLQEGVQAEFLAKVQAGVQVVCEKLSCASSSIAFSTSFNWKLVSEPLEKMISTQKAHVDAIDFTPRLCFGENKVRGFFLFKELLNK